MQINWGIARGILGISISPQLLIPLITCVDSRFQDFKFGETFLDHPLCLLQVGTVLGLTRIRVSSQATQN